MEVYPSCFAVQVANIQGMDSWINTLIRTVGINFSVKKTSDKKVIPQPWLLTSYIEGTFNGSKSTVPVILVVKGIGFNVIKIVEGR